MKLRIIIADDEFVIMKGLRNIVAELGASAEIVGEARDGEELLSLVKEKRPHIVISDIAMPKMTSLEVLRQLSEKDIKPYFILISGYQDFGYARQAVSLGVCPPRKNRQ